jgi:hypothetical protein
MLGPENAQHTTTHPTRPSQAQHDPTTTIPAAPPSQIPRSQRYSQSSNLTKRSHDSVGSISIPSPNPPQTTVIECLSELAPTTQLAAPSQNHPAKHARQTQSAPSHTTKKRKRSQMANQQHLPFTQNLFPSREQLTNIQPNKCITRSHTTCHNQPTTQTLIQTTISSIPQDNSTNPFTQQINNK